MSRSGDVEGELELLGSLRTLWDTHGHYGESVRLLEDALVRGGGASAGPRSLAYQALATVALSLRCADGDLAATRAVELYGTIGESRDLADALIILGLVAEDRGDVEQAEAVLVEAAALCQRLGYGTGQAGRS